MHFYLYGIDTATNTGFGSGPSPGREPLNIAARWVGRAQASDDSCTVAGMSNNIEIGNLATLFFLAK